MEDEYITLTKACALLEWDLRRLKKAIAAHKVKTHGDAMDGRKRLIATEDLDRLKGPAVRPG